MTTYSRPVQWLRILLFLFFTALLFAWSFEWDRYQIIVGPKFQTLSALDIFLVFWLLLAQSLVWFLPLLLFLGFFVFFRFKRTAAVILNLFWIGLFYYMAADLASVGFAGFHATDYLPHIKDILASPEQKIWQWAGGGLSTEAILLLTIFVIAGPICFYCVSCLTARLANRLKWLNSTRALTTLTLGMILVIFGVIPSLVLFKDRSVLERVYLTMALPFPVKQQLQRLSDYSAIQIETTHTASVAATFSVIGRRPPLKFAQRPLITEHDFRPASSNRYSIADDRMKASMGHPLLSITGRLDAPLFPKILPSKRHFPINFTFGHFQTSLGIDFEDLGQPFLGETVLDRFEDESAIVPREIESTAQEMVRASADPGPVDSTACVKGSELPNIIMVIFESFRPSALSPGMMKRLDNWADKGLRLERHYSGSNCSHLGLFSLLYGRAPLRFHETLDRAIPAQMLESLRQSGYEITLLSSGEIKGFRRMADFMNEKYCDHVIEDGEFTLGSMNDWPDSDRRKLAHAQNIVNSAQVRPQCVFFYLLSSHYRYPCPSEFEILKESTGFLHFLNPREQIRNHLNRYANSLLFLEHELMNLIESIDPNRNIVIVTGDHGESMGEDGVFTHASRMSEVQMRTPFVMVGPGVKPKKISTATVHTDVLPTLLHVLANKNVPIKYCQGRDLLSDSPPADEVTVVPANGPDWDGFIIIRGDERMAFRLTNSKATPSVEFAGMVDEVGQFELRVRRMGNARYVLGSRH
ncbi:MAG: sulfatase-like hydrolase/transferase [Desulfomonilaceae bacterium]